MYEKSPRCLNLASVCSLFAGQRTKCFKIPLECGRAAGSVSCRCRNVQNLIRLLFMIKHSTLIFSEILPHFW